MAGKIMDMDNRIIEVLNRLTESGFQAYLVGGCVRDKLLGTEPHDFDVATDGVPEEVEKVFREFTVVETGLKHGTVTAIYEGLPVEITTFRRESKYSDGRHPDRVEFSEDLEEDLKRRDFTINAMAMDLKGEVMDLFGGREDLERGTVRAVGNPEERFREDGLRILRALRFAAGLGFRIEEETEDAIFRCRDLLNNISAERISSEFNGILTGEYAFSVMEKYWKVIETFVPEIGPMVGFDQRNKHHIYDVYSHSIHAMEMVPASTHLRLAALFHDIGKPSCFSVDEKGTGHFYGHAEASVEITRGILKRLKYDGDTRDRVLTLIKWHDRFIDVNPKSVKRVLGKLGEEIFRDLILIKRGDNLAQAPQYRDRQETYDQLEELAEKIISEKQCFNRAGLAIDGRDLMASGIEEGPRLGEILDRLVEMVIEGEVKNEKEELIRAAKAIYGA